VIRRVEARIPSTISTSPANTHRQLRYVVNSPPMSGPTATATAPAAITRPYARERPSGAKLAATSATIAGRINAAPTPSNSDHPISRTGSDGEIAVVKEPAP
jgi:hypothetical protein